MRPFQKPTPMLLFTRQGRGPVGLSLAALLASTAPVLAHPTESVILHVAETGRDAGDCHDLEAPCRTIDYALGRVGMGDTIRIAAGTHRFAPADPFEILHLLSDLIEIETGFDAASGYRRRAEEPTYVVGPLPIFAEELREHGLILVQAEEPPEQVERGETPEVPTLFVVEDGTDEGDCTDPDAPCATIEYALAQAPQGASIEVAGGSYAVPRELYDTAEERDVTLRGGFLPETAFTARAPGQATSFVIGPPPSAREELAQQGFVLVQDQKYFDIVRGIEAEAAATSSPPAECVNGSAGAHPCHGLDLVAHVPLAALSSNPEAANDVWGFVDLDDQREYAMIGLRNGTAFLDVTDPSNPREIGTIPGLPTIWRDIKVLQRQDPETGHWNAWAYITADAVQQGWQIVDLNDLPNSISLAATDEAFASAHNVYLANTDYATGAALPGTEPFAYVLGSSIGTGSFRIFDLDDPIAPALVTTPPPAQGYTHDAASVLIDDARAAQCGAGHDPCEVLIDYNETTMDLWDVTDKASPIQLASLPYPNARYTHSGWWSADKRYVFIQDELDEQQAGLNTTVRVVDIADLRAPRLVATWSGPTRAIDHNGFTVGNEYFISNYRRGLTVLDISDPERPVESLFFDTFTTPSDDSAVFNGAWGVYPYLPSGTILVSDIENGLFMLRRSEAIPPPSQMPAGRDMAFAWANRPGAASYAPSATYAYNPVGPIAITRSGAGRYAVRFVGFGGNGTAGGNVQVTSWGPAPTTCRIAGWSSSGADFVAHVRCQNSTGAPADERFTILVTWSR